MTNPDHDASLAALYRAADRAATEPSFMAHVLETWGKAEGLTWTQAATRLGCTDDTAHRLALCRRPDPSPDRFSGDVERIAAYVNLDPDTVARAVRKADALQALRRTRPSTDTDAAATGLLMAALDRLESESSGKSSDEDNSR